MPHLLVVNDGANGVQVQSVELYTRLSLYAFGVCERRHRHCHLGRSYCGSWLLCPRPYMVFRFQYCWPRSRMHSLHPIRPEVRPSGHVCCIISSTLYFTLIPSFRSYLFSTAASLGTAIWQAKMRTTGDLWGSNVLAGIAGSLAETICQMTIADMFFVHQRGTANGIYIVVVVSALLGIIKLKNLRHVLIILNNFRTWGLSLVL